MGMSPDAVATAAELELCTNNGNQSSRALGLWGTLRRQGVLRAEARSQRKNATRADVVGRRRNASLYSGGAGPCERVRRHLRSGRCSRAGDVPLRPERPPAPALSVRASGHAACPHTPCSTPRARDRSSAAEKVCSPFALRLQSRPPLVRDPQGHRKRGFLTKREATAPRTAH